MPGPHVIVTERQVDVELVELVVVVLPIVPPVAPVVVTILSPSPPVFAIVSQSRFGSASLLLMESSNGVDKSGIKSPLNSLKV